MKSKRFDSVYRARLGNGLVEIALPVPKGCVGARMICHEEEEPADNLYADFKAAVMEKDGEFTAHDFPDFDKNACAVYLFRMCKRGLVQDTGKGKHPERGGRRLVVYSLASF